MYAKSVWILQLALCSQQFLMSWIAVKPLTKHFCMPFWLQHIILQQIITVATNWFHLIERARMGWKETWSYTEIFIHWHGGWLVPFIEVYDWDRAVHSAFLFSILVHFLTWARRNWQKAERGRYVLRVIQPSTHSMLGEYDSCPLLARYVWYFFALLIVLRPSTSWTKWFSNS